jgi:hypothetical protein
MLATTKSDGPPTQRVITPSPPATLNDSLEAAALRGTASLRDLG